MEKRVSDYLAEATDGGLASTDTNGSKPSTGKSELCILALEDDSSIRHLTEETNKRTRHRVVSVARGEETLEQFEANIFDVLFADVSLPGSSGVNLIVRFLNKNLGWSSCSHPVMRMVSKTKALKPCEG